MNINDMFHLSDRIIKNLLRSFITHKIVTCDERNAPWIDNSIRCLIQNENEAYKRLKRENDNCQHFEDFQSLHS